MSRYGTMKRSSKNSRGKRQFVDSQKRIVRGVLLLIFSTLIIVFIFGDHGIFQLYKLKKERENIQKHIAELRKNRELLTAEKNRLENDLNYIEQLAREKYRMAKPGEKVFKVITEDD
tara:strand:+ start:381 stop:731 length:351 start_codon:yes stop_codon:yes gene_type:complete